LAVVEGTGITSFAFNLIYVLGYGFDETYRDLFIETTEGPRLLPCLVPDKARFTEFAHQIANVRRGKQPGCYIKAEISVDVAGDIYKLLKAHYDVLSNVATLTSRLAIPQHSVDDGHRSFPNALDETSIVFRLYSEEHAELHSGLISSADEEESNTAEDSMREDGL
jgi:hypothetical protein